MKQCTVRRGKIFSTGLTRAAKAGKSLLYRYDEPNVPTNQGPLSFVLFELSFISESTVSMSQPSLVSLVYPQNVFSERFWKLE